MADFFVFFDVGGVTVATGEPGVPPIARTVETAARAFERPLARVLVAPVRPELVDEATVTGCPLAGVGGLTAVIGAPA